MSRNESLALAYLLRVAFKDMKFASKAAISPIITGLITTLVDQGVLGSDSEPTLDFNRYELAAIDEIMKIIKEI